MITPADIQKTAHLSKLNLTEEEEKRYLEELSGILGFFEKLEKVDTENVEPLSQVTGLVDNLRKDEVESFDASKLLNCSPREKHQNMVSVPPVF